MTNLFKKALVFTDLHLGLKSNSHTHNEDCLAFVQWAITTGKAEGCDACLMLGDWHNNRASINIVTLNYSLNALELLGQAFDTVFFIPGNHDLYYRDKRDVQSAEWARHIPNIQIINDFFQEGDVSIVPWLVGDDHKKIQKLNAKYVFGHFELPNFYMNAMVKMPEHGELRDNHFSHVGQVFSGHFHKRQSSKNITYIGNCFPHNYADAGDDDRGVMILEWGQEPVFKSWPNQPLFRVYSLSDVLNQPETLLQKQMHCRINIDIDISYEEALLIKETYVGKYDLRELTLIPIKNSGLDGEGVQANTEFESIDTIVTNQITSIESGHYDPNLLLEIYRNL